MYNPVSFREIESFVANFYPGKRVRLEPFSFVISPGAIADNASGSIPYRMSTQADFIVTSIGVIALTANIPNASTLQIVESGSNEQFFDSAVPINVINQQFGMVDLPYFRRIAQTATLTATINSVESGAETWVVCLNGVNVYEY